LVKDLENKSCEIAIESDVTIKGKHATLAGKIDVLAFTDTKGIAFEVKSGKKRDFDRAQLLIYLWMLQKSPNQHFRRVIFDGMLVYEDARILVPAAEVSDSYESALKELILNLVNEEPPRKYPSSLECKWCNIADCDERMEQLDLEVDRCVDIRGFF
jgi:hypothetical protein